MTDSQSIAASDVDEHTDIQIDAPEHPWYYAQIRDWITLCPDVDHTAYRVYCTFIAITTKHARFKRRLTLDQVRWLVPGVNGKAMSQRTFRNALKMLDRLGLVQVDPYSGKTEQARDATTGQFIKQESVLFKIGTLPTDPDAFDGWCNGFDKLDAYPGPGWDDHATQAADSSKQHRAQNSAHGHDQEKQGNDPSGHRVQNSARRRQNSARRRQNSAHTDAVPTENEGPQYSPPTQSSNNQPMGLTDEPSREDADQPSNGWLDDDRAEKDGEHGSVLSESSTAPTGKQRQADTVGARLLRSLRAADGTGLAAWAVSRHQTLIDGYLEVGHTERQITSHLTAGIQRAGGIQAKLAKLADGEEQLPAISTSSPKSSLPPVCGQCDAWPGDGPSARIEWVDRDADRFRNCPRCHPHAQRVAHQTSEQSAGVSSAADRLATVDAMNAA